MTEQPTNALPTTRRARLVAIAAAVLGALTLIIGPSVVHDATVAACVYFGASALMLIGAAHVLLRRQGE